MSFKERIIHISGIRMSKDLKSEDESQLVFMSYIKIFFESMDEKGFSLKDINQIFLRKISHFSQTFYLNISENYPDYHPNVFTIYEAFFLNQ